MKQFISMVSAMALILALMAAAANADLGMDTALILFQGTAKVCGQGIASKPMAPVDCPIKFGENQGLYQSGQGPGPNNFGMRTPGMSNKWIQRTGNYVFASSVVVPNTPACTAITLTNPALVKPCAMLLFGKLAPVGGIGAACDISHGYGGGGSVTIGGSTYSVSNFGWPASAGGVMPITGTYDLVEPGAGKSKGALDVKRIGPIVGAMAAQGGAPCLKSSITGKSGASVWNIIGTVAMI